MSTFCTVIRHHNSINFTEICVESLSKIRNNSRIYIVEDGSTDGSEKLLAKINFGVEVVVLSTNGLHLEYCRGLNVGMQRAVKDLYDYIFVVNTDTKNFSENYFLEAEKDFLQDPMIGKWGSKVFDYEGKRRGGGDLMNKLGVDLTTPTEGYILSGKALKCVGYFDEKLVRYFEDLDLILRLRESGFSIYSNTSVSFDHFGGGLSANYPYIRNFYRVRNIIWFLKYYRPATRVIRMKYALGYLKTHVIRVSDAISSGRARYALIVLYSIISGVLIGLVKKWK
jgi:GT2 family glycosyltransferase